MAGEMEAAKNIAEGEDYVFKWSKETTGRYIRLRAAHEGLFTGAKFSAKTGWRTVLEKMGLEVKVTPQQAKKKWDNLKDKYKQCKYPASGQGVAGKPTAETWPWYVLMDEVLGQRPSIQPPVLLSSIPEDIPGPSSAVGQQGEPEGEGEETGEEARVERVERKRKRDQDELFELIKEDMETSRQERRERMDRMLMIMEKLVEKLK